MEGFNRKRDRESSSSTSPLFSFGANQQCYDKVRDLQILRVQLLLSLFDDQIALAGSLRSRASAHKLVAELHRDQKKRKQSNSNT